MKKIFTLLTLALLTFGAKAQISTFPANEGFEAAFTTGLNVQFIPNWNGNIVSYISRIFADSLNARTGLQALGAIPTSTTSDTIIVNMDLSSSQNLAMTLWAKADANGVGTRSDIVYGSTSIDGGLTYSIPTQIGDSTIFANATQQQFNQYTYAFPTTTNFQQDVRLRITISRGAGSGTAARFIMDDVQFTSSSVDITPPTAVSAVATSPSSIDVTFSEAVNSTATNISHYTGIPGLSSISLNGAGDKATLTFSPAFTEGVFYTLNVSGVADVAGNVMTTGQNFPIVFNDNTGNVKLTEINYNDPGAGTDSLEFIEIKNMDANTIDIGGWQFTSGVAFTFPSGYQIQGGQYLVIARFPINIFTVYNKISLGWDAGSALNNTGGETITLSNASGVTINSVTYNNALPWDTAANGHGPSLVLCGENADNTVASNWTTSLDLVGVYNGINLYGSPGGPCVTVGLNEVKGNDFAMSVYPNPATDRLQVNFASVTRSSYTLRVIDVQGRELTTMNTEAISGQNHAELNITYLSKGIYFVVVESAAGRSLMKFAKN